MISKAIKNINLVHSFLFRWHLQSCFETIGLKGTIFFSWVTTLVMNHVLLYFTHLFSNKKCRKVGNIFSFLSTCLNYLKIIWLMQGNFFGWCKVQSTCNAALWHCDICKDNIGLFHGILENRLSFFNIINYIISTSMIRIHSICICLKHNDECSSSGSRILRSEFLQGLLQIMFD